MDVTEKLTNLYVVIMAGGKGSRFWPVSCVERPKQLLPIIDSDPMILKTINRISNLVSKERTLVVAGAAHSLEVCDVLSGLPEENILIEPVGRNTAACIGFAAITLIKRDPNAVMLVLPADHIIEKETTFHELIKYGYELANRQESLITFGISPDRPETGYGYIEIAEQLKNEELNAIPVISFHEKPDIDTAQMFLAERRFLWNSGMFIWKAQVILNYIDILLPELGKGLKKLSSAIDQPGFNTAIQSIYPNLPSISIDYGVMEKAVEVLVLPADIGWSDVGSWSVASKFWPKDGLNRVKGQAILVNSKECAVYNTSKHVALVGVKDLIVVVEGDSILICNKNSDQMVKIVIDEIDKREKDQFIM